MVCRCFLSQNARKVLNEFEHFLLCINYKIYFSSVKTYCLRKHFILIFNVYYSTCNEKQNTILNQSFPNRTLDTFCSKEKLTLSKCFFFPLNQQISTNCFASDELAFFWHKMSNPKKFKTALWQVLANSGIVAWRCVGRVLQGDIALSWDLRDLGWIPEAVIKWSGTSH